MIRRALLGLIRLYQLAVSPWLGARCRFEPSCSKYAVEALQEHGVVHGSFFAIRRLARCHPWHEGGYDPVPPSRAAHDCRRHHP